MPDSHRSLAAAQAPRVALAIVLLFGAWSRWRVLPTLSTNIDDIGVASAILEARHATTAASLRAYVDSTHGIRSRALRLMDRAGLLPVAVLVARVTVVPRMFTYAPAQFLITAPLISERLSYREIVRRGRLASFAFGVLAALLVALAARELGGAEGAAPMLVAGTLMACSWELVIYSAQMESYAVGVAGTGALLLLLAGVARRSPKVTSPAEIALVAVLPWLQYQLLFLLPGYVAARAWLVAGHPRDVRRGILEIVRFGVPAALSTAVLYHYFLGLHASAGVNWNAGPHGEYLFQWPRSAGVLSGLAYTARFFVTDAVESAAAIIAFLPGANPAYGVMTVAVVGLAGIGAWVVVRDRSPAARAVAGFTLATAAVWCVLIVLGKITLSPTRHSLVLLPFLALSVAFGVGAIGRLLRRPVSVAFAAAALCVCGFGLTYGPEVAARRDAITRERVDSLLAATSPDLVVEHDCTWNLRLMFSLSAPVFDTGCVLGPNARWVTAPPAARPRRVLFINGDAALTEAHFDSLRTFIDRASGGAALLGAWPSYDVRLIESDSGRRELEFSDRTHSMRNGFYATLLTTRGAP